MVNPLTLVRVKRGFWYISLEFNNDTNFTRYGTENV